MNPLITIDTHLIHILNWLCWSLALLHQLSYHKRRLHHWIPTGGKIYKLLTFYLEPYHLLNTPVKEKQLLLVIAIKQRLHKYPALFCIYRPKWNFQYLRQRVSGRSDPPSIIYFSLHLLIKQNSQIHLVLIEYNYSDN